MDTINVEAFRRHPTDTGSPEVQVAALTIRIANYERHFRENRTDRNNLRGLKMTIGARRRHLLYLRSVDIERYRTLIDRLGLRPLPT